ncbi:MAG: hypothetical protein GEU78_17375 [Actinobacteria bacterium]|nr:hypothetical protein [Actinomycetota bacterium]
MVVDAFREDVRALRAGEAGFADTSMFAHLPPLHLARYDVDFADRFLAATEAVAGKLRRARQAGWPYPSEDLLGSVAEERAMEEILAQADAHLELGVEVGDISCEREPGLAEDIETLREVSFKDRDFEWLFQPAAHGLVEDLRVDAQLRFMNLRFAEWFRPFWEGFDPFRPEAEDCESG